MFNADTTELLKEKLLASDVKQREGTNSQMLSYLASHHVIDEANRIFGFGSWGTEIQILKQVDRTEYEKPPYKQGEKPRPMISISYLCQLKLTVTHEGRQVSHEDTGFGNGVAGHTAHGIGQCIELASKEAVTDALKRCFRYYGNKFGNSLYDKDDQRVMSEGEAALTKKASSGQWADLKAMMADREIDDEWLSIAMRAQGYTQPLEEMSQPWFPTAYKVVYEHKLDEVKKAHYDVDIAKRTTLIKEASNIKMLRLVYGEAVKLAQEQGDTKKIAELTKEKDARKKVLEAKD